MIYLCLINVIIINYRNILESKVLKIPFIFKFEEFIKLSIKMRVEYKNKY